MSFYDWDYDGDKDMVDNFIEYQIYNDSMNSNNCTPRYNKGISTFGAIIAIVGGLFSAAVILSLFGCEEDPPIVIAVILWVICSAGLGVWFDSIKF